MPARGSQQHLAGYTGMINLETIGGRIIEVHLRFADQWPDLYGKGWVEALVRLYRAQRWDYPDADRRDGYSVVLFGPHGPRYRHPPQALVDEVRAMPSVSSVQITFHEDKPPDQHAMPPGGFRLAIVNCFDLAQAGRRARSCARSSCNPEWAAWDALVMPGAPRIRLMRMSGCRIKSGMTRRTMLTSRDRILTTHVGSLPRNDTHHRAADQARGRRGDRSEDDVGRARPRGRRRGEAAEGRRHRHRQ